MKPTLLKYVSGHTDTNSLILTLPLKVNYENVAVSNLNILASRKEEIVSVIVIK